MTHPATTSSRTERQTSRVKVPLLLLGFAASVGIRVTAGQPQVNSSAAAGLLFAGLLGLLAVLAWQPTRAGRSWTGSGLLIGAAGACVLCLPPVLHRLDGATLHRPAGGFITWALVVSVVAVAEEVFLRGVLFDALLRLAASQGRSAPPALAIAVTAVAFALLHVPLYGWGSLPLDLSVGIWLGVLRQVSGTVTAPAAAHVLADLAGWWLR